MINRSDMVAIGRLTIERAIAHPPERAVDWSVRVTSGTTTGSPLLVFFRRIADGNLLPWREGRTVICYSSLSSRLSTVLTAYQNRDRFSSSCLAIDPADLHESITPSLAAFAPECITGFPSFIMKVGEYMDAETASGVDVLVIAGERLTEIFADSMRKRFPNAKIIQMYACMELGFMSALPCEYLGLNKYHMRDGFDVEIDDPDEDGCGAVLIYTTLNGDIPISKYMIGDTGRLILAPCVCGAAKTLEIFGRSGGDFVKVLGATVRRDEFERVISLLAAKPDDYRLETSTVKEGEIFHGSLTTQFYYKGQMPTGALQTEMARTISENFFLTPTRTLAELVQVGLFVPISIECTNTPFPSSAKDVKLIQRDS